MIQSGFTTSASISVSGRNCARVLKPFTIRFLGSYTGGSIGYFAAHTYDTDKSNHKQLGVTSGSTVKLNKDEYITFQSDGTANLMYSILDPDFVIE